MFITTSYSDPEEEFGEIIHTDPQLKMLLDDNSRHIDYSDERYTIVEDDVFPTRKSNKGFWSDR